MNEKEKILVIDDDKMSLRLLERVFQKAGMEGVFCQSGDQAFQVLDEGVLPDVILLDVHMPDVSGFDILKRLRVEKNTRNVPVVFLTGDEDVKTESLGLSEGAADFIRKPFASEVLIKIGRAHV